MQKKFLSPLLCVILPLTTQGASSLDNLLQLDLNTLANIEIETVYSASKSKQRTIDAPANITIVTATDIKLRRYKTLGDLLAAQSGFYKSFDRNYGYLGVRGFSPAGDYNTKVLLLIDGQRINDNLYSAATIGNDFPVPMDLIERIEIIRGPGSSLYGTSALFGVINVITKSSKDFTNGEVSVMAGNFGTHEEQVTLSQSFKNSFNILLSAYKYHSDGDTNLFYKEFAATNNGYATNQDRDHTNKLFLKANYKKFTLQAVHVAFEKRVPTAPWETIFNQPLNSNDNHSFINMKYKTDLTSKLKLSSQLAYNHYYFYGDYKYDINGTSYDSFDEDTATWVDGTLDFHYKTSDTSQWLLGFYGMHSFKEELLYEFDNVNYLDVDEPNNNYAMYLQSQFKSSKNLNFNLGLRYDYYDSFGSRVSPRLSCVYNPSETSALKFIYGQAFRAPNAYELRYTDGETLKGNPELQEEIINNYEIIYEKYFSKNSSLLLNAFYYQMEDLIVQEEDNDTLLIYRNLDKAETLGLEINYKHQFKNLTQWSFNYTYQKAINTETDMWLPNSPRNLANTALSIPFWNKNDFTFALNYVDEKKSTKGPLIDAYTLGNVIINSNDFLKGLDLSAGIYNVFDTEYAHSAGEEHNQTSIAQDGINFRLKLKYKF